MDIPTIITICVKAISESKKLIDFYKKKKLSDEEKLLLVAANKRGEFHLLSVDQIPGIWVRADEKDFLNEKDPAFAAIYLDAFKSLCGRSYITYQGGILFNLTGEGFKKARDLAKETPS